MSNEIRFDRNNPGIELPRVAPVAGRQLPNNRAAAIAPFAAMDAYFAALDTATRAGEIADAAPADANAARAASICYNNAINIGTTLAIRIRPSFYRRAADLAARTRAADFAPRIDADRAGPP